MDNIELITRLTFLFFVYLILALLVERTIELLVSVFKYVEMKRGTYAFWNNKARQYQQRFERLYAFQGESDSRVKKVLNWLHWKVISDAPYTHGQKSISAALIRLNAIRVTTRVISFLLSLLLVLVADVDIIVMIKNFLPGPEFLKAILDHAWVKVVLSAGAISIGSEPLHELIRRFEDMSKQKTFTGGAK